MGVLDALRLDGQSRPGYRGSRGLGLQIAHGLGEAGAAVAITARREDGLARGRASSWRPAASRAGRPVRHLETTKSSSRRRTSIQRLGKSTSWSTTPAPRGARRSSLPLEAWDKVIRTNVDGTSFVSRAVGTAHDRAQAGRPHHQHRVGRRPARQRPGIMPTLAYNTSKGAVVNFTRALAATLAEHNITVNCICPGFFPTRMSRGVLERSGERIVAAHAAAPRRRRRGPQGHRPAVRVARLVIHHRPGHRGRRGATAI